LAKAEDKLKVKVRFWWCQRTWKAIWKRIWRQVFLYWLSTQTFVFGKCTRI